MNLSSLSPEIDLNSTLDRLCGDAAFLIEILDLFLDEFFSEQPQLLEMSRTGDFAGLSTKAHYYKGISQNLGLLRFLPEVISLEQAAKQGDAARCTQAVNAMDQIAQRLLSLRNSMPGH